MEGAYAWLFIPKRRVTAKPERDHTCSPSDPVEKGSRSDAASKSHPSQGIRFEMLATGSIHIVLNDVARLEVT